MRHAAQEEEEWTDDSAWPRRLLHVASMTSYPWTPGNVYGGHRAPRYNAITYTWGRFALRPGDAEYAETDPLRIHGVAWPVPRVRASHFTAAEFRRAIESAAVFRPAPAEEEEYEEEYEEECEEEYEEEYEEYEEEYEEEDEPADFVWLDVACIDQTYPRTDAYYREVGRQATIFRGAQEVVVWLTTFDGDRLGRWWAGLKAVEEPVVGVEVGNPPAVALDDWVARVRGYLREMQTDPWFTSLWTLQEAFLRPKATILCREGRYRDQFGRVGVPIVRSGELRDLVFRWNDVLRRLRQLRDVERLWGFPLDRDALDGLVAEIGAIGFLEADDIGFQQFRMFEGDAWLNSSEDDLDDDTTKTNNGLVSANPLMLLAASHHRECWEETDRVRGIMQVFGLRLGESAPDAVPGKTYSLAELEDQLAAALLQMYPVSSQLMRQDRACPTRKAWRVSPTMTPLENVHTLWRQLADQGNPADVEREMVLRTHGARLSPAEFETTRMVHFEGRYSTVETFVSVLGKLLSPHSISLHLDGRWRAELESADLGTPYSIAREFTWLSDRFRGQHVGILFLARARPPPKGRDLGDVYCDWGIGLLICREEEGRGDVYQRLGVLIWDLYRIADLSKTYDWQLSATGEVVDGHAYLNDCTTPGWADLCGHFG